MKLHTALITGGLVTTVMADRAATRLRRLNMDSKSKKSTKSSKSSYSLSYSMSYSGEPTVAPRPRPPALSPPVLPPTPVPTSNPTAKPTGTCCDSDALRQTILANVYNGDVNESIFDSSPQREAIAWLDQDACECGQFCTDEQVAQRYILAVLYYSTAGDSWTSCATPTDISSPETCQVQSSYGSNIIEVNNTTFSEGSKWLTCNSECEWAGTNCNRNNFINAIDMENNNLDGELPSEVGGLPNLAALALEQNEIEGNIPASYSDLTKLVVIDFDFNSLTGNLINLGNMNRLQQLDLNNNNLGGSIEGLGWEQTKLRFLDLAFNSFTGEIPSEIGELAGLDSAQFQCNQFDPPLTWENCPENDLIANDDICSDSSCPCTSEFDASECAASASNGER